MKLLSSLILLLMSWVAQPSSQRTPVFIGGFFPLSPNKASVPGRALLAAAELALHHVNKSNILRDYELRMIIKDSKVCRLHHFSPLVSSCLMKLLQGLRTQGNILWGHLLGTCSGDM